MRRKNNRRLNSLSTLQQNSWELELLVSAVMIGLLWQGSEYAGEQLLKFSKLLNGVEGNLVGGFGMFSALFITTGVESLLVIFISHIVIRSMWVAAIGLYDYNIKEEIQKFQDQTKFKFWINKTTPTPNEYIKKLDRTAKALLGIGFLLFFTIISLGIWVVFSLILFILLTLLIASLLNPENPANLLILFLFYLTYLLASFLYLLDFITGNWVKRKFPERLYFPIFKLLSTITLARFYRFFSTRHLAIKKVSVYFMGTFFSSLCTYPS